MNVLQGTSFGLTFGINNEYLLTPKHCAVLTITYNSVTMNTILSRIMELDLFRKLF